jgi:CheY-like chemotaxis protein
MMTNKKYTMFIADDDQDYLYQLKFFFENNGFNVITASLQSEAEELIPDLDIDIAVLDLMMEQDDSGFILARLCKKHHPHIPVIIATAVATETGISFSNEENETSEWIKADLYLEKGIRLEQLLKEVMHLIDKQ